MMCARAKMLLLVSCLCLAHAGATWAGVCDEDEDGLIAQECGGNDCDDGNPTAGVADFDGDGFSAIACGGADCDDNDANRYPGNAEVCDALDHDEDCDVRTFGIRDADGDMFADATCCNVDADGTRYCGDDCDDFRRSTHPIAGDVCDGEDNNCDGAVDEHAEAQFADFDLDGHGDRSQPMGRVCPGTAGFSPLDNDCDDTNPAIEPGDMVCNPDAGSDRFDYCASNGSWLQAQVCPDGGTCVTQPNGSGACVPEKVSEKTSKKSA